MWLDPEAEWLQSCGFADELLRVKQRVQVSQPTCQPTTAY